MTHYETWLFVRQALAEQLELPSDTPYDDLRAAWHALSESENVDATTAVRLSMNRETRRAVLRYGLMIETTPGTYDMAGTP